MKRKMPQPFLRALATHRNRLERVVTAQSVTTMRDLYDEATGALTNKLKKSIGGGRGSTFSAHQQRIVLTQLREGQAIISQRLAGKMGPLTQAAQEKALKGLASDVSKLHKVFTGSEITLPIEEASVFAGVVQKRQASLLRASKTSFSTYGANVVKKVEKELALTLLKGESPGDAIDAVAEVIDGEWWQGERIVRTEMAYAYNATHRDGIIESAKEIPDLWMQWEEHCDESGEPLDDRVAVDSIAMHGQVAPAGGSFYMPATAPFPDKKGNTSVPFALVGKSWDFPPNRPNDRAVLSPWMKDWGVPGWRYVGGKRVSV